MERKQGRGSRNASKEEGGKGSERRLTVPRNSYAFKDSISFRALERRNLAMREVLEERLELVIFKVLVRRAIDGETSVLSNSIDLNRNGALAESMWRR